MVKVRFRKTAERDLREIGLYTAEHWSEGQAEIYLGQLLDIIEQISLHPTSGQDVGWLRRGYRRRRAGSHLIFYVLTSDGDIEIARVLHERADASHQLDD
ncbi:type II toxin-antitoxin system RelE/ParE family toxin [Ciceribacter selenitireducens]|uniref:Toxin n=1 Tax=Ciceribacter selenitireducens ATCC BAA-1503 TaxID=1336235 RepID=A0A376ABG3_9HYPH|nr:type II toxin-antitoxin system RelE/ParE family toxin [Ciceribacter selenitireducens]SSC65104.1 unnamed protein product [Ciceribacter selenitireducens ATCC BAA-1503]